jgi:hypothetical protein
LMFNITTTKTPKANATPSIWTKQQCIAIGIKRNFVFRYFCLKCLFVEDRNLRRKYAAQNAGNGVSGLQISNIFRGGMPPDPPSYARSFQMLQSDYWLDPPLQFTDKHCKISRTISNEYSNVPYIYLNYSRYTNQK